MAHVLLTSLICCSLLSHIAFASDIIIDSGHSPQSSGAVGCSGRNEHDYNIALSEAVKLHLEQNGRSVSLTTVQNNSLASRSKQGTGNKVFLSIHHDSVQPQFVKRNDLTGGNCSSKASGFSIFVSRKNPDYKTSLLYAQKLGESLVQHGLKPTLHHAEPIKGEARILLAPALGIYTFDDLQVLQHSPIPALLLEASVIVNPKDEREASSPEFQRKISEAVLRMITIY